MRLAQTQSALFSLITQDGRSWLRPDLLVSGGALSPDERVHVYAEQYRLRTRDALRDDFPQLGTLLGDRMDQTVDAYVDAYPSSHPSLHRLGHAFAAFLEGKKGRADLADLAALEWARAEAFVAVDTEVATPEDVQRLGPERLPAARMEVVASLALLELEHDVDAVWRAMEKAKRPPAPRQRPTRLVVWRKGLEVFHARVEADELAALRRAKAGATVGECLEAFAGREDPARAAFTAFGSWLSEQMVSALQG